MSIPDPNIYLQDEEVISTDLLPVRKRKSIHMNWLKELLSAAQWLNDLLFKDYAAGQVYPAFQSLATYYPGVRITFIDGANYERIYQSATLPVTGQPPDAFPTYWTKLQDNFVGARERARYNGQKLMLEYMLNRRYQVALFSAKEWEVIWIANAPVVQSAPPYTQIYIKATNNVQSNFWLSRGQGINSYLSRLSSASTVFLGRVYSSYSTIQFTIYVPIALYTTIGTNQLVGVTADQAIRAVVDQYVNCGSIYEIVTY